MLYFICKSLVFSICCKWTSFHVLTTDYFRVLSMCIFEDMCVYMVHLFDSPFLVSLRANLGSRFPWTRKNEIGFPEKPGFPGKLEFPWNRAFPGNQGFPRSGIFPVNRVFPENRNFPENRDFTKIGSSREPRIFRETGNSWKRKFSEMPGFFRKPGFCG